MLVECRSPRHELEAEPIVDHREAARRQRDPFAEHATDMLADSGRTMRQARALGDLRDGVVQVTGLERLDHAVCEDDPLALAPRDPEVLYYSAMVYMESNEQKKALQKLEQAVAAGYPAAAVRDTPNFSGLEKDPRFRALISTAENKKERSL